MGAKLAFTADCAKVCPGPIAFSGSSLFVGQRTLDLQRGGKNKRGGKTATPIAMSYRTEYVTRR